MIIPNQSPGVVRTALATPLRADPVPARVLRRAATRIGFGMISGDDCIKVWRRCFTIMMDYPELAENGCHCDCVWFEGAGWGLYIRCEERVG